MALEKLKTLATGYDANYWRLGGITIDVVSQMAEIKLLLYKNQQARNGGKGSVGEFTYQFSGADFPFTVGKLDLENPFKLAYKALKALPEFTDASDV